MPIATSTRRSEGAAKKALSAISPRGLAGTSVSNCNGLPPWIGVTLKWVQAEHNAFFMCDKFEKPLWVELLPAEGPDSDAFDEELCHEYS